MPSRGRGLPTSLQPAQQSQATPRKLHSLTHSVISTILTSATMSAAVRLAVLAGLLALAAADIPSLSQVKEAAKPKAKVPFKACIDDSDCAGQGTDYACFQYLCYPWKDDSSLAMKDKRKPCKKTEHCATGQECYRHPDRRNIYMGLCMEPAVDCSRNSQADCNRGGMIRHTKKR